MADDIQHMQKQMQKNQVDAQAARTQAQLEITRANQYRDQGNDGNATYHQAQADNLNRQAEEMEKDQVKIEAAMNEQQKQLESLMRQKDELEASNAAKLKQLNDDIARVKGDSFSF